LSIDPEEWYEVTKARGAGPGEEGKEAVSMTDGTAGGLGAAALTGGALIMQGGVE